MKAHKAIVLLLVLFPTLALTQKKPKKPDLPAVFGQARYVYVEAIDGDIFKPSLYPEDRQAIVDVEYAVRDWGRYMLTTEREQAELVFVVRRGRVASGQASGGVGVGTGPQGPQSRGQQWPQGPYVGFGGEVGPADDLLQVCMINSDSTLSNPLWNRTLKDGLSGPQVPLFQQFRSAVEKAYPNVNTGQKTKP